MGETVEVVSESGIRKEPWGLDSQGMFVTSVSDDVLSPAVLSSEGKPWAWRKPSPASRG